MNHQHHRLVTILYRVGLVACCFGSQKKRRRMQEFVLSLLTFFFILFFKNYIHHPSFFSSERNENIKICINIEGCSYEMTNTFSEKCTIRMKLNHIGPDRKKMDLHLFILDFLIIVKSNLFALNYGREFFNKE